MTLAVAEALLSHGRAGREPLLQEMGRRFVEWHRSPDNNRAPGATCGKGCENLARGMPWRKTSFA